MDSQKTAIDVITISRQLGSLGWEIASAAAARLGFRLVSREVINQAALRAGAPEVALAIIDELGLLGLTPSLQERKAYVQAVHAVMNELAAEGKIVIVGRAGQVILRARPNVLHVRVIAPEKLRVRRVAAEQNISLDASQAQVNASDHSRHTFLRRFYRATLEDPYLYDMVLNTAHLSIEQASACICQAVEHTFQRMDGFKG